MQNFTDQDFLNNVLIDDKKNKYQVKPNNEGYIQLLDNNNLANKYSFEPLDFQQTYNQDLNMNKVHEISLKNGVYTKMVDGMSIKTIMCDELMSEWMLKSNNIQQMDIKCSMNLEIHFTYDHTICRNLVFIFGDQSNNFFNSGVTFSTFGGGVNGVSQYYFRNNFFSQQFNNKSAIFHPCAGKHKQRLKIKRDKLAAQVDGIKVCVIKTSEDEVKTKGQVGFVNLEGIKNFYKAISDIKVLKTFAGNC